MDDLACSVGDGLARALARAKELRANSPRRVAVRIVTRHGDLAPGVIVVATVPARTNPELEAQSGKGVRFVALDELDARAHELPALVEAAAAEVEAAVAAAAPPTPRASRSELDFDHDAYDVLVEDAYRAMLESAKPHATKAARLTNSGAGEAMAVAALKTASLAALGAHIELNELLEMLRSEYADTRSRYGIGGAYNDQVH